MTPINGLTVFTSASSRTNKAVVVWHISDSAQWHKKVLTMENASLQILELTAIQYAFQLFSQEPVNIVTDSAYAANVVFHLKSSNLRCLQSAFIQRVTDVVDFD